MSAGPTAAGQEVPFRPASRQPSPAGIDPLGEYRPSPSRSPQAGACGEVDHLDVKPSTAVRHLVEMATVANDRLPLRDSELGWPLEELWVGGDLLVHRSHLEAGSVVLVLDLPPEELPWLAMHPVAEWVGAQLRLGKRPFLWSYRPILWPVWNQRHRRVARFWSARSGIDAAVLDALRDGRVDDVPIVEPSTNELEDQLRTEVDVSGTHVRTVLAVYWDTDWRRLHKGTDTSPEDQLWRAAQAAVEVADALHDVR